MYKIERKTSGYLLTFSGVMDLAEMQRWVADAKAALTSETGAFGVVIDMRHLAPLLPEVQTAMVEGQQAFKGAGMSRSSVLVNNSVTAIQFKRLAQQSGIYAFERYFDGSKPD